MKLTKEKLIEAILDASKIHHNISTLSIKLPEAPENVPDDVFLNTCEMSISDFVDNWLYKPINDSGNRNICECRTKGHVANPTLSNGACKKHDLWHIYQAGRSGATLYWNKYWNERQDSVYFKLYEADFEEKNNDELETILKEMSVFNDAVKEMMNALPESLKYEYEQWEERDEEEKRHEALGYNKTLRELLESKDQTIKRHAKGILSALQK